MAIYLLVKHPADKVQIDVETGEALRAWADVVDVRREWLRALSDLPGRLVVHEEVLVLGVHQQQEGGTVCHPDVSLFVCSLGDLQNQLKFFDYAQALNLKLVA